MKSIAATTLLAASVAAKGTEKAMVGTNIGGW
jgi:hypothetical protein